MFLEKIIQWLSRILGWEEKIAVEELVEPPAPIVEPNSSEILYEVSVKSIGKEMSPQDLADDEVACVESLEGVIHKAFGFYVGGKTPILGTWSFLDALKKDERFEQVDKGQRGDIILSPTGSGNGRIRGHCGILGNYQIMSNNSFTSLWDTHFTHDTWYERYEVRGDLDVYFFRIVI